MLSKLRIWIGATAFAVVATSGGVVAAQAYDPPVTSPFTDVATSHTFYRHIAWLADEKISTGYGTTPNRTYEPSAAVLREQMAAFLYRLAGEPEYTAPAISPFIDVDTSHVFYKHISWLAEEGISTGYANGNGTWSFRPGQPVLREQMAAFLYRYDGITPDATFLAVGFADVPGSHVFKRQIEWLSARGVSTGYPGGSFPSKPTFRPADPVLREQMAAFMYRLEDVDGIRTPVVSAPESVQVHLGEQFSRPLSDPRQFDATWTVRSGSLPPGVRIVDRRLIEVNGTASIEGASTAVGTFTATLRYQTGVGSRADRTIVITVTDPNAVDPEAAASRSDLAVSLFRCEGPEVTLPDASPFSDLPLDDPRFEAVYWAHVANLVPATGDTARPDEKLTRALAAEYIYRYAGNGHQPYPGQQVFDDVPPNHPNYVAIDWAGASNAIVSEPVYLFQPEKLASQEDTQRYRDLLSGERECADRE